MTAALKQRTRPFVAVIALLVATVLPAASTAMAGAPVLKAYSSQSSLPGVAFTGPAPMLAAGSSPVTYVLVQAPTGMTIDSVSGVPSWATTVPGNYRIQTRADNAEGNDTVEWILLVADDFSSQDMVSTRYTDFVVSPSIVDWMGQWQPHQLIDGAWLWLRNDYQTRYQPYDAWIQSGGNAENYSGDTYGAWQKILFDLAEQYGSQLLQDTLLAYRPDGLSRAIRDGADTTQRRPERELCQYQLVEP